MNRETLPAADATRMADADSMRDAVLELQSLARQSRQATSLPPLEFALRYGSVPPVLAGRAREMAILRSMVDGIQNHKGDQCLLGLHGIRGQGKTALIRLLEDMALRAGIHVVTLRASGDAGDFAQAIMGAESLSVTTSDAATQEAGIGLNAVLKAQGRTTRTRQASETRAARMSMDTALEHRLAQGDKILLVLDEAHTLRTEAAQALFNAYQAHGVKGVALGLAFAGTPDLPGHLSNMRITFTERPGRHGQTPLGPISDANAAMAVLAPFAERGVLSEDMAPNAPGGIVEGIAAACCGYPYYTQLLGDALLQAWAGDGRPKVIRQAHLAQAMQAFETECRKHYQKRFLELKEIGAVECARNIALALQERADLSSAVLEQCLVQGLQERGALEQAGKIVREEGWIDGLWSAQSGMAAALLHLGFLWSPEGSAGDRFHAGIPSLTGHVLEAAPPCRGPNGLGKA